MANVKIDVEVSGVERTIRKIKRDIHRGMEQSADTLVDNARKEARRVISEERAIFNSEVYSGFRDATSKDSGSNVRVKLYNDVEHAEVLEEGAAFPAQGPPVAALLPWVARKMNWGSSFEPDIYGGSDYFDGDYDNDNSHDDDDGSDDGGGGSGTETTTTDEEEIRQRFNRPLRERNEITPVISDSEKPLKKRMDDYERKYTEDFEKDDPDTYIEGQEILYEDYSIDSDRLKDGYIESVDEDKIVISDTFSEYHYYFPHVTEAQKEEIEENTTKSVYEMDVVGVNTQTSAPNLEPDDKIIIDGDESSVSDWEGNKVYATVDYNSPTSDEITVHAKYSSSEVTVPKDSYLVAQKDSEDPWDFEDGTRGSKVEYWDDIYNQTRVGYLTGEPSRGHDGGKAWELPKGEVIIPETGRTNRISGEDVISIDNSVDYFSQDRVDVPENDLLENSDTEPLPDSISEYEKEDRYRVWNHRTGEFYDAEVASVYESHVTLTPNGTILNKLTYKPDSEVHSGEIKVTPVAKYKDEGDWDIGYPVIDNQNQLWYGQEVTYESQGIEREGLVSDWDSDWVYLSDSELDKVPRVPTVEENARLTGGEDWSDTVPSEIRGEQLEAEFRHRVNHNVEDNEIIDDFGQFIREDYFSWIKEDEVAQETLAHMSKFSDKAGVGAAGSMSPNDRVDKYHYDLKVGVDKEDGDYSGFNSLTAFHEMQHGLLHSHALRHNGQEIAQGFTGGASPLDFGEFDEWPETVFNSDGSPIKSSFDQIGIDEHGPISEYIIENQGTGEQFGNTDFNDIIKEIPNDDADLGNIPDSEFEEVSGPDLFDESDFNLKTNDVIRIKNENGDVVEAVFSSSGTEEETYWKFLDKDENYVKIETDSDGSVTSIKNVGDDYDDDFTWTLDSHYENTEDPLSEPISEWMPDTDNRLESFVTAGNRSLRKQLWMIQNDDTDGDLISNRVSILRGYAASNAHETVAGLTSLMQSDSYKHSSQLPQIYYHHPFLVKSYLDLYEPSAQARQILEKLDDPELNKYL